MTRKETEEALALLKITEHKTPFRHFMAIYTEALYEAALEYGVDPDSKDVWFYYDIKDGKGTKWV